jgi:hypothetical protein
MRNLSRLMTQWFGAALEAYKLKTHKSYVDADMTLAIHQACEKGFNAMSGAQVCEEQAISAALEGDPLQDVVLSAYAATTNRSTRIDLYLP